MSRVAKEGLQGFPSRLQLKTVVVMFPRTLDTRIGQSWEASSAMCATADYPAPKHLNQLFRSFSHETITLWAAGVDLERIIAHETKEPASICRINQATINSVMACFVM